MDVVADKSGQVFRGSHLRFRVKCLGSKVSGQVLTEKVSGQVTSQTVRLK